MVKPYFAPHPACNDPNSCAAHNRCMYMRCPGGMGKFPLALAALDFKALEDEIKTLEGAHEALVQRIVELEQENEGLRGEVDFLTETLLAAPKRNKVTKRVHDGES